MKLDYEELEIKAAFETITTPEYNIANPIESEKPNNLRSGSMLRRIVLVSILCLSMLPVIGYAKDRIWKVFYLDGTEVEDSDISQVKETEASVSTSINIVDDYIKERQLISPGSVLIRSVGNGQEGTLKEFRTNDMSKLRELAKNSNTDILLPAYIPEGYMLTEGVVNFYISKDMLNTESTYSEREKDTIIQEFQLPEQFWSNISNLVLIYKNSEGEQISFDVSYSSADGTTGFGAPPSATSEKVDLEGFEEGLIICDEEKANPSQTYYSGAFTKMGREVKAYSLFLLGIGERIEAYQYDREQSILTALETSDHGMEILNKAVYFIEGTAIDKEELIKIMESVGT